MSNVSAKKCVTRAARVTLGNQMLVIAVGLLID